MNRRSERGLTLVELTVVMILAALATVGLVTFYLNSQAVWIDASTQSMVQRDATLLLEEMTKRVRRAADATVTASPDSTHHMLTLFNAPGVADCWFVWDEDDSLVHLRDSLIGIEGMNPVVGSKVERFQLDQDLTHVYVHRLRMVVPRGDPVEVHSSIRMYNSEH